MFTWILLWTPKFAVDDLCEDEGDCEDVAAEDGGGKRM